MKSNLEKISTIEHKLNIEVPAEEVQAAFTKAFQTIQRNVIVKGFRKGKAPLTTIRTIYIDRVKQDVVQDIIQNHYANALQEHALEPISFPAVEFDPIEEEKPFAFSAEFEIRPEVKLVQTDHLPVKKEKFEMKPNFIEETLEQIRSSRAETVAVFEDRPAQKGDIAVIDFEGSLVTGPLENGSAKDHELELGASQFIPGFEEGVTGMKIGVTNEIKISFPENYHVAELAGKPVTFKTTLKGLKKKALPELNDEFAKTVGTYENMEQLKEAIREDFVKREEKRIADEMKNRLMRALVERNPVDVPKSLLTEQKKALIDDMHERMKQQGMDENTFEDYKMKWDDDFSKTATFMIRSSFLIDKISAEHKLRYQESDLETKLKEYAAQTGIELARIREFYAEDSRKSRLAYSVTEEKVVSFLLEKADVKEVSREEIEKEDGTVINP